MARRGLKFWLENARKIALSLKGCQSQEESGSVAAVPAGTDNIICWGNVLA